MITATCTCGRNEYHEHDVEDRDWFGPFGWFRKHPTDPSPNYCSNCGEALEDGGKHTPHQRPGGEL